MKTTINLKSKKSDIVSGIIVRDIIILSLSIAMVVMAQTLLASNHYAMK